MVRSVGVALVACLLTAPSAFAQAPTLPDVLARAGAYAVNYGRAIPILVADERADEVLRGFGIESSNAPGMEGAGHTEVRLMRGVIVIESTGNNNGWQVYRDIFEVNSRVLHAKQTRLEQLFRDSPPGAAAEIAAIVEASRRWQIGSVPRTFSIPTFAMMLLLPQYQSRFSFKRSGEKKVDGETVWVVTYQETKEPTLVVTTLGDEYPMHGELWIEPATGRLVKSKMIAENTKSIDGSRSGSEAFRPRITIDVAYKKDPALQVWVPAEMKQLYVKAVEQVTCTAKYSNVRVLTPAKAPPPK